MHAGTITWNGLDLTGFGRPRLTISQQADPPAPAQATRQITTLKVTVEMDALDPGTIAARIEHLQASMRVAEGILQSSLGCGYARSWMATPGSNNLPQAIGGMTNTLELGFTAMETHTDEKYFEIPYATFTPAGTEETLTLHAVRDITETVTPERHSPRASARRLTNHTFSFTARVAMANPADPLATRIAYLQAQAEIVKSLDCREGTLVFGSLNRIVRVTEFTPQIDEGRGVVDLKMQCFYSVLPDPGKAEANYEMRTRDDAGSGERTLVFSGTIEAETRAIAFAKLNTLRANLSISGRRATMFETSDRAIDGADTEGVENGDWTGGITFTLEMKEPRQNSHYELKITSTKDIRSGMRWVYSGSVSAASESAALSIARALVSSTGHPVRTRSEESIERTTDAVTGGERFVKLTFTYEFEGPADGFIGGEISTDRNDPLFGNSRRTISGFLVAATRSEAETRLEQLLTSEGQAIEKSVKGGETYLAESGETRVFQKLEFSASFRVARGTAAVKYTDSSSNDVTSMLSNREVNGSIWADSEAVADGMLATLATALFGGTGPSRMSTTDHREQWTGSKTGTAWLQLDFTMGKNSKLEGVVGYDIIEASLTVERIGGLNATPIKTIPYGRPIAQTGTGWLPGKKTINASCKARLSATAIAWVQGKRALAGGGYETDQPKESLTPEYAPFSGVDVTLYRFQGSYGYTFVNGLDGVWTGGL